jgi:uncharacterized protein (DUF2164 family)
MTITLAPEVKKPLIASIKRFFDEKLEQDIGDLKAELVLDYALREIAPTVYNRAIADAQAYFTQRTADLEGSCYEKEFTYWAGRPARGRNTQ